MLRKTKNNQILIFTSYILFVCALMGSVSVFAQTRSPKCQINSFTADNSAPLSGTGTTLRFSVSTISSDPAYGGFRWSITPLVGGTYPSPNSGVFPIIVGTHNRSMTTGNLNQSHTYRLTCFVIRTVNPIYAVGHPISDGATIIEMVQDLTVIPAPPPPPPPPPVVLPTVSLTALPPFPSSPLTTNVTWTTTNSPTSCTASSVPSLASWSGPRNTGGGNQDVTNIISPTALTLTCSNSAGSRSASVNVAPGPGGLYNVNVIRTTGGFVKSTDTFINCGSTCARDYPVNNDVTLQAIPSYSNWKFVGWTGACSGTGDCVLRINSTKTVKAHFQPVTSTYKEL